MTLPGIVLPFNLRCSPQDRSQAKLYQFGSQTLEECLKNALSDEGSGSGSYNIKVFFTEALRIAVQVTRLQFNQMTRLPKNSKY